MHLWCRKLRWGSALHSYSTDRRKILPCPCELCQLSTYRCCRWCLTSNDLFCPQNFPKIIITHPVNVIQHFFSWCYIGIEWYLETSKKRQTLLINLINFWWELQPKLMKTFRYLYRNVDIVDSSWDNDPVAAQPFYINDITLIHIPGVVACQWYVVCVLCVRNLHVTV